MQTYIHTYILTYIHTHTHTHTHIHTHTYVKRQADKHIDIPIMYSSFGYLALSLPCNKGVHQSLHNKHKKHPGEAEVVIRRRGTADEVPCDTQLAAFKLGK